MENDKIFVLWATIFLDTFIDELDFDIKSSEDILLHMQTEGLPPMEMYLLCSYGMGFVRFIKKHLHN